MGKQTTYSLTGALKQESFTAKHQLAELVDLVLISTRFLQLASYLMLHPGYNPSFGQLIPHKINIIGV